MTEHPAYLPGADHHMHYYTNVHATVPHLPELIYLKVADRLDWPAYFDGAWAPHLTIQPRISTQDLNIRQHYALNRTARMPLPTPVPAISIVLLGAADEGRIAKFASERRAFVNWPIASPWVRNRLLDVLEKIALKTGATALDGYGLNFELLGRELSKRLGAPIYRERIAEPAPPLAQVVAPEPLPPIDKPWNEMTGIERAARARAGRAAKRAARQATLEAMTNPELVGRI